MPSIGGQWARNYLNRSQIAQGQREERKQRLAELRQRAQDRSRMTDERAAAQAAADKLSGELKATSRTARATESAGRGLIKLGQAGFGAGGAALSAARSNNINIYFAIAMLFHLWDSVTSYTQTGARLTFYFFMAVLGWLWIFKEQGTPILSEESARALGKSAGLAAAAFLLPVLVLKFVGTVDRAALNIIVACWPFYLVWFAFAEPQTRMLQRIQKVVVAVWLFIAIMWVYKAAQAGTLQSIPLLHNTEQTDFFGALGNVWQLFWESIKDMIDAIKKFFQSLFAGLSGGYTRFRNATFDMYTGKVDSAATLKLGVYLEEIKASSREYYAGKSAEPINIWATLVSRTLEKPIEVKVDCWMNAMGDDRKVTKIAADRIYPKQFFTVTGAGETKEDIDCLFEKETVREKIKNPGSQMAYLAANFDFETMAYIKAYFMDKDKAVALKREKIEPLEQFGIKDKNPVAVYTNGPVMIGMELKKVPVELNRNNRDENIFTLGVTIKNRWEGEIVRITKVRVIMPKEIRIQDNMCSGIYFREAKCSITDCDDKFHNVYEMSEAVSGEIKTEKTFRCPLEVQDPAALIGDVPIATKYLKATAEYNYKFEKSVSIRIKEVTA